MKAITHFLFGFAILFTSFSVICLGDSPVLAVVFLIATFVLAALYLILIGISFIGITYIILYVGAIAVLFLFVIMMLNLKDKDLIEPSPVSLNNGIYSFIIVILFAFLIYSLTSLPLNFENFFALDYLGFKDWSFFKFTVPFATFGAENSGSEVTETINNLIMNHGWYVSSADILVLSPTQIETLGYDLYSYGSVLLIILSIMLLLGIYTTIIISKHNELQPQLEDNTGA